MDIPYRPDELFVSTAPYYARYRAGYPPGFFDHLVKRFALDGTQIVLDLGCGPGQIALALAPHVAQVLAVDPEPTMLDEGRRLAEELGITNIDWQQGDSYRLDQLELPALDLVTMGMSFHWTDRAALLAMLDTLVTPAGGVVVIGGGALNDQTPPAWEETITTIRARYLGAARRAGSGTYTHPEESHAEVFHRSPFSRIESAVWEWPFLRDLDSVVGLQFSFSFSAPALFGDENVRIQFEQEIRAALTKKFPEGDFIENISVEALIATRAVRHQDQPI